MNTHTPSLRTMPSFTLNSSTAIGIASTPPSTTGDSTGPSVQTISFKPLILCTQRTSYANIPLPQTLQIAPRNLPSLTQIHWNQSILHQEHNWWKNSRKHLSFRTLLNQLKGTTKGKAKKGTSH